MGYDFFKGLYAMKQFARLLFLLPCWLLLAGYTSGTLTVVTSGTAVQLSTASPVPPASCISLTIAAKTSNTGTIYIGGSNVSAANKIGVYINSSFPAAYYGPSSTTALYDPQSIYIDATVSGDGVSYTCYK